MNVKQYESRVLPDYRDDLFGLPVVIKNAVVEYTDRATGETFIEIPDEAALESAMAVARVFIPLSLSGADLKFLRKACGMTIKEFSDHTELTPKAIELWERDPEGMGHCSEMKIRVKVLEKLRDCAPTLSEDIKTLEQCGIMKRSTEKELPPMIFRRVEVEHSCSEKWDCAA